MQIPEGLGLYWRDNDSVQLGLHPERSAVFPGLYAREVPMLNLLRNPCTKEDIHLWARSNRVDSGRAEKIWADVEASGLAIGQSEQALMARSEYAAATRAGSHAPGAVSKTAVEIHGAGLTGALLALMAELYGFGAVRIEDENPVTESLARWLGTHTFGKPIESVIRPKLRPPSASVDRTVVVSVSSRVFPLHIARTCLAEDVPYLPIVIAESDIQIGPFVTGSPCVECVESARTQRDRAWPLLAAQAGRLPMVEAETASAFQVCALVIGELLTYVANPRVEPRLSASILHVSPPPTWPHIENVKQMAGCGCGSGPMGVDNVEDR